MSTHRKAHPPCKGCKRSNLSTHLTNHVHSNPLIYGRIVHSISAECPEYQYNNHETEKVTDYTGSTMSGISARLLVRYLYVRCLPRLLLLQPLHGGWAFWCVLMHKLRQMLGIQAREWRALQTSYNIYLTWVGMSSSQISTFILLFRRCTLNLWRHGWTWAGFSGISEQTGCF
jgi:hypothetical protein